MMPLNISSFITGFTHFVFLGGLIGAFITIPTHVRAQDCSNPNGALGDVIFNESSDVFQGCSRSGWRGFNPPIDCTNTNTPGMACPDGAIYAGTHNGNRLYTTASDQTGAVWKTSNGSNDIAVDSSDDGLANSNQVPNSSTFPAFKACKDLAGGPWYLPSTNELQMMILNGGAIGGFSNGYYNSSTESSADYRAIRFYPTGAGINGFKNGTYSVRCVRR